MTLFQEKVYSVVKKIPKGRVSTYKNIARLVKKPRAYRAVGNVLNKNKNRKVPCHRVIRSDGQIGGYRQEKKEKIRKLTQEGVIIMNGRIEKQFIWPK